MLELTTAFVIACMPAARLFVQHYVPYLRRGIGHTLSAVASRSNSQTKSDNNTRKNASNKDNSVATVTRKSRKGSAAGWISAGFALQSKSGGGNGEQEEDGVHGGRDATGQRHSEEVTEPRAMTVATPRFIV